MKIAELHAETWRRLQDWRHRLPHALLISGAKGLGKVELALNFAAGLLCEAPREDGLACNACPACQWFSKGNHPDFRVLKPEALRAMEERGEEESKGKKADGEEKKEKSNRSGQEIPVDEVRELGDFLAVGTHRQKLRVILIHPAEALNRQAANALLKSLEEPPPDTLFLLVSHEPMRLLPTLRSRCQNLPVPLPGAAAGEKYLADAGVRDAATWLALAGGAPVLAKKLAGKAADWLEPFLDILKAGPSLEVIATADSLEKKLKAAKGENPLPQLVDWAQKWVVDLNLAAERQPIRFYFAQRARITTLAETLAEKHRTIELTRFYRHLLRLRRESAHPLNARLFLEQFLFRYRALFVE